MALRALFGPPWRGDADLYHLWHPPQPRISRVRGSHESWTLRRRYAHARQNVKQMRKIVEEARLVGTAHQQRLHAA